MSHVTKETPPLYHKGETHFQNKIKKEKNDSTNTY